jgi:AmiR/NasT family two-component response regulator
MLRRTIAGVPGLEVVGEVTDPAELSSLIRQSEAQWVIVSIGSEETVPSALKSGLAQRPALCILGLAADGSQASVVCAGSSEATLDGLSLDDLIAILKERDVSYSGNS